MMAHYAYVDGRNIVTQVVVGKNEDEPLPEGVTSWEEYYGAIRCSYNTYGGVHSGGGTPFRKNYPGIGYTWDPVRDAFIPPKPYASWVLNEDSGLWEAPVPMPEDGQNYYWDEETTSWVVDDTPTEEPAP
jgi:hypothetical protein